MHPSQQEGGSSPQQGMQGNYRQFVTTLLDSSTNKLVQITSQPPPDYVAVKKRRNRVSISCMSCKRRKVKCDRKRPICGSCQKHGYSVCVYVDNENYESNKIRKQDTYQVPNMESLLTPKRLYNNDIHGFGGLDSTTISKDSLEINNNKVNYNEIISTEKTDDNNYTALEAVDTADTSISSSQAQSRLLYYDRNNQAHTSNTVSPHSLDGNPIDNFNKLLDTLDDLKLTHVQNDDIDQLRDKIEHLRFYLDDNSITNSKILRGLTTITDLRLLPVLETNSSVSLDSFEQQFASTSITSFVGADHCLGTIFKKSLPKIENDLRKWKSYYSIEIYFKALENVIISEAYDFDRNVSLEQMKVLKFKSICKLLEDYFLSYDIFSDLLKASSDILKVAVPVVPQNLINFLKSKHFVKSPNGKLEIIHIETDDDFSEVLLILAVLRFGLPKSENVIRTPDEVNFRNLLKEESILTDNKTDLLHSFLKIILNETDLTQKYNIPILGTLMLLFMIQYTHRFNFKSGNTGIGLNFGIMAVYMAVNLGVYNDEVPPLNSKNYKYLKFFSKNDFHNIWNLIMFVDTFSSFNSGIPQLISSNMDNIFVTNFVNENCARICQFYRKAFRLANTKYNCNNKEKNQNITIIQYERYVLEFEHFFVNKIELASESIMKNDIIGVANSIRASNLLLFLYYNSYFSFFKTFREFECNDENKKKQNYGSIINEFRELESRLFERCIKLSIICLIDIDIMLVSTFAEGDGSFYEKYSFDLIQVFTRIIYTLTSCICKMISTNKQTQRRVPNTDKSYTFLFDISKTQSEQLAKYFVASQCTPTTDGMPLTEHFNPEIVHMFNEVSELSKNPSAMIKLLIGFFFYTSRSLISQNFIYYALYKYFVMAVKQLEESTCTCDEFDIDTFEEHFSYVDCTWFINK